MRGLRQKIKRKIKNCKSLGHNWRALESAKRELEFYKYPRYKKTAKFNYESNKRICFNVPVSLDYYKKSHFHKTNAFIEQVRSCGFENERRIHLNFSNTRYISAAAMLSLLAEVDLILGRSKHRYNAVNFNHPNDSKIESILNQVGFYDLVRKDKRKVKEFVDVSFWRFVSGNSTEPLLASKMIRDIQNEVESKTGKNLYRGFIEAMSNSVEHAYLGTDLERKWWAFAGIKDGHLVVVICDKGVGIPSTLPRTRGFDLVRSLITSLFGPGAMDKDSSYIKAAAEIANSRTNLPHRGKGLNDMKSVIRLIGSGMLSIFSNRGLYSFTAGHNDAEREETYDFKTSVAGTIVEWVIPIEVSDEPHKSC